MTCRRLGFNTAKLHIQRREGEDEAEPGYGCIGGSEGTRRINEG